MGTKQFDSATNLITFTRASGGTALRKVGYGTELVTNGTFDTDTSGWTTNSLATLSLSSGSIRVENNSNSLGLAIQEIDLEAGKTYHFSANLIAINDLLAQFTVNTSTSYSTNVAGLTNSSTTGTKTFNYTPSSSGTYYIILAHRGGNIVGKYVEFDNISVKEIIFDRVTDPLVLYNHSNNTPRIEYNADGTVKGLLIEEARTNLVTYSIPTVAAWATSGPTITENAAVSPDGSTNATRATGSGSNSTQYIAENALQTTGIVHTCSVYFKTETAAFLQFVTSKPANSYVNVNASTLVLGTVGAGASNAIVTDVGNGWARLSFSYTPDNSNNVVTAGIITSATASRLESNPLSTSALFYGYQSEAGAFPTSYIPTSGSTATRAVDVATIPTSDFGYNSDAGSVYVDGTFLNGDTIVTLGSTTITADADGNKKYTATYSSTPSATEIALNQGTYSDFKYYPRRLSNAQLQELTT